MKIVITKSDLQVLKKGNTFIFTSQCNMSS